MYSEITKIIIDNEINSFERMALQRILSSFDSIESEALEKRKLYLETKSKNFDPERDDEGCIEENGYFEELNHVLIESALMQEYLNSVATWLFHLFERQKKRVFYSDKTDLLKLKLAEIGYHLDSCTDWNTLNKELRLSANAIKHGSESDAAKELQKHSPKLFSNGCVILLQEDIERYLAALRDFWSKALYKQVIL